MSSALASMYRIARELGLRTKHRDDTIEAAEQAALDAGTGDDRLDDLTELPFVTIDYETSWDLDQALFIRECDVGYEVFYALADAAYFVPPNGPLFVESMERGTSFYLPGLVLPMLPESLSEGVTSLLPHQERRALTFRMVLDHSGIVVETELVRAKIRSRAKLTYRGVQHFLDAPSESEVSGTPYQRSLELLARVGTLRIQLAERREVVRYDRVGVRFRLSEDGHRVIVDAEVRNAVQLHNEQISLLCNIEGAKLLIAGHNEGSGPAGIFRLHDPPSEERLDELVAFIDSVTKDHEVDASRWSWRRAEGESLADYVARLPADPDSRRLAQAIQRQAMVAARPSYFATEPGPHYGIGAGAYSRFSAPMRELVGIVTQHVALSRLAGGSQDPLQAEHMEEAVRAANRAKELQKQAEKQVQKVALDQLFHAELDRGEAGRTRWTGTVMGITPSKVYVQLDDPPVDVKLYASDLVKAGLPLEELSGGSCCQIGGHKLLVGGAVTLVVGERLGERWLLIPADTGQ